MTTCCSVCGTCSERGEKWDVRREQEQARMSQELRMAHGGRW
jgi:hypothetical protein